MLVERGGRKINRLVIIALDALAGEVALLLTNPIGFISFSGYCQVKRLARRLFLGHDTWLKRCLR